MERGLKVQNEEVSILNSMLVAGLLEKVPSEQRQGEGEEWVMWTSGKRHSGQRAFQHKDPDKGACLVVIRDIEDVNVARADEEK